MKLQLTEPNRVPYGSEWRYQQPGFSEPITAPFWELLLQRVRDFRKANSLPIGLGFEEEIEAYVCAHQPSECSNFDTDKIRPRKLTLSDIITGTRTMLSFWWNGKPIVQRAEAERRAAICVNCPNNVLFAKSCTGICAELREVVSDIINHQGTQFDSRLHSCQICGCFLQASIWIDSKLQVDVLTPEQQAQFETVDPCWKKRSLL